jgi:DNA-binding NtrC family response regulator
MQPKHVLIVDDDPSILEIIARVLASPALRVSTARRVTVARDMLAREQFDLILTDARIPGETGLQLAETARELGIATIVMTGDPEWVTAHGVCPDFCIAKPFDVKALMTLVSARLGGDIALPRVHRQLANDS